MLDFLLCICVRFMDPVFGMVLTLIFEECSYRPCLLVFVAALFHTFVNSVLKFN